MIDAENVIDVLSTDIRTPIPASIVSKIISLPPFVTLPGVSNFRDLSHDNVLRPGYAYRSGNLSDLEEKGKSILAGDLGITTIFDLRNQGERERAPSPEITGIETIWMPYGTRPASLNLRDFTQDDHSATGFVKMYMGILNAATPIFTEVFSHIRDEPNDPFIFHCSAGKDRTGVLSALILLLIGRPHEEIIIDYLYTRVGLESVRENLTNALALHAGTDHLSPEANGMLELSGVRASAMEAFLKTFETTYDGGVEIYLNTQLGFSFEDIVLMRKNLTNY
ncbi:uncharacterized protein N7503_010437 [Penicillium pulvis]|uniref:uncharacterized protein n=1 Tax=Penicillium pulvis TaxID=1562058 RepID=UPI0025475A31|nr:uncharacterized protein N7503_010437 [Penicillium pulvis]KAJ5785225.1 hypothetical protein N7503_010437 [Penicillium pulvis]